MLANLLRFLPMLPESESFQIDIAPHKKARSGQANKFMWSALYAPLVSALGWSPDEWHEFMCGEFWGWKPVTRLSGATHSVPKRTTTKNELGERDVLKGQPFADFLSFVESTAAARGVFVDCGANK